MNVTYWFGAGASAQALPVISNFEEKIAESKKLLGDIFPEAGLYVGGVWYGGSNLLSRIVRVCYDPLLQYVKESRKFTTIDTLSKYYMVSDPKKFNYYKRLLKAFFLIEDFIINRIDGRYLGLIASISESHRIGKNVNFLTWNYDNQLYKAKAVFGGVPFTIPKWEDLNERVDNSASLVYHINGSGYDEEIYKIGYGIAGIKGDLGQIVELILDGLNREEPTSIRYAFEDSRSVKRLLHHASERLAQTNILVIVGYSFPYFNRFIDTEILQYCVSLEKIYIQDANPEPVIERLQQLSKGLWEERDDEGYNISLMLHPEPHVINGTVTYEVVKNLNAFHIPVELD